MIGDAGASFKRIVRHAAVVSGAGAVFTLALAACRMRRLLGTKRFVPRRRILLIGTFYNTNWFVSHARPLAASGLDEVVVVTDEPGVPLERVRFACPPPGWVRLLGRPLSRMMWVLWIGWRERPDVFMGYHVIPNAVLALLAGRLVGRPACYQMTGGPVEIEGGGIDSENSWLTQLRRPSPWLERLGRAAAREFDLVVVRGSSARRWVERLAPRGRVAIVPGSVDPERVTPREARSIDLLYVGRFTEVKRPLEFVEVAAEVIARHPGARAVMIGDGPLLEAARSLARERGAGEGIEFRGKQAEASEELGRARVFVLTSRSEGLSIAMAEAMMAGAVPVVSHVGDLADLVQDGENGFLAEPGDRARFVASASRLLAEPDTWARLSAAAQRSARGYVGLGHVSALWARHLGELAAQDTQ